jgi:pescadillo protein
MLTFLELYQTLLGFVFFKLYTDAGLVYPPPLDLKKYEAAAGVGAFSLQETSHSSSSINPKHKTVEVDGRTVSGKDVRQVIKTIAASSGDNEMDSGSHVVPQASSETQEEEFVVHPSKSTEIDASLPTYKSLETLPKPLSTTLFAPYTFFLSREISRSIFEFLIRSFGGRVGWPASSGDGSPINVDDMSVTHVIIDRPIASSAMSAQEKESRRKYVQPQWIVDCINAGKILLEEPYTQGQTLPPHLSPFGELEGAYDPTAITNDSQLEVEDSESEDEETEEVNEIGEAGPDGPSLKTSLKNAIEEPSDLRTAELAAEVAGMDYDAFEKEVNKLGRKNAKEQLANTAEEEDMNKMMMSNKKRKLYEKMRHSQKRKESEVRVMRCRSARLIE